MGWVDVEGSDQRGLRLVLVCVQTCEGNNLVSFRRQEYLKARFRAEETVTPTRAVKRNCIQLLGRKDMPVRGLPASHTNALDLVGVAWLGESHVHRARVGCPRDQREGRMTFSTVLVVGAGQMGGGIAQVIAASGREVFLYDP